jgi:hypothetical protein
VNLGTWTERASDASGPADVSLPLLEIGMQAGRLTAVLSDTSGDQHELERFEAPA